MVELAVLAFRIDPGGLLAGQVVIPELIFERPRVLLEVSPQGEPNWIFTTDPVTDAAVETVAPEDRAELPMIGHLLIEDGKRGAAEIDTSAEQPVVRADLQSTTLDINQLRNLLASKEARPGDEPQDDETVTLELAPLQAVNAEAELQIAILLLPTLMVNGVSLRLRLENGRLAIDPLAVALGGGKARARLMLDAGG